LTNYPPHDRARRAACAWPRPCPWRVRARYPGVGALPAPPRGADPTALGRERKCFPRRIDPGDLSGRWASCLVPAQCVWCDVTYGIWLSHDRREMLNMLTHGHARRDSRVWCSLGPSRLASPGRRLLLARSTTSRVYSTHAHQALLKLTKLSHLGQPNCTIATSRTVSSSGHAAEPCKRSHIVESLVAGLASWLLRA